MYDALLENILYWIEFVFKILMSLIVKLGALAVVIGIIILILYCLYLAVLVFIEYEKECKWSLGRYIKTSEGKILKDSDYEIFSPKPKSKKKVKLNENAKEENLF